MRQRTLALCNTARAAQAARLDALEKQVATLMQGR
jgi:hypothetical protein